MEDQKAVELFIFENIQNGNAADYIADELLKLWSKNKLKVNAKRAVGRFCISNGFVKSLISVLKHDLKEKQKTFWPFFYYFNSSDDKQINDAFLTAAANDDQLNELALFAKTKSKDPRWEKILNKKTSFSNLKEKMSLWPQLKEKLESIKPSLSAQDCTELSVALSEMGLSDLALQVLNYQKTNWTIKEEFLEIRYLLDSLNFITALEKSQSMTKKCVTNSSNLKMTLYYTAHAYYGLNDKEQAVAVLKGIKAHDPNFYNVSELIRIWEKEL